MGLWRNLTDREAVEFRKWARQRFEPNREAKPTWHPVVREEWSMLQDKHDQRIASIPRRPPFGLQGP